MNSDSSSERAKNYLEKVYTDRVILNLHELKNILISKSIPKMLSIKEGVYNNKYDDLTEKRLSKINELIDIRVEYFKEEYLKCECRDEWMVDVRLNLMYCKKCGREY